MKFKMGAILRIHEACIFEGKVIIICQINILRKLTAKNQNAIKCLCIKPKDAFSHPHLIDNSTIPLNYHYDKYYDRMFAELIRLRRRFKRPPVDTSSSDITILCGTKNADGVNVVSNGGWNDR